MNSYWFVARFPSGKFVKVVHFEQGYMYPVEDPKLATVWTVQEQAQDFAAKFYREDLKIYGVHRQLFEEVTKKAA